MSTDTTVNYAYNSSWKDQLTSFNGQSIIYDQAGNPTLYRGATLTWQRGRLLDSFRPSGSSYTTTFKHDANGIRRQKVVPTSNGSATTTYIYRDNNLLKQVRTGTNPHTLIFLYNSQGVIGFVYNGTTYTYRKNLFGDIIAIYNSATKVAEYTYDAWGNHVVYDPQTNSYPTNTTFIGNINPFRYRGYYYDSDLGLYYLMSRYYDPQTGRFINADSLEYLDPETIGGLNLYAYCGNNPVMYADPSGHVALSLGLLMLIGFVVGAAVGAVSSAIGQYFANGCSWENFSWEQFALDTVLGGITTEESYDKVELIISQMQLRKRTQDVLTCYINGMGVCEISRTLHICHATVWRNRMLLREKYKQVTGIEY